MKRLVKIWRRKTLSVDNRQPEAAFKVAILWGLLGCSGIVAADDEVMPDIEFLEYLGSWEESDEDWVVLAAEAIEQVASEDERTDPASKEKESVETDDES
jgi:hypothetical protein